MTMFHKLMCVIMAVFFMLTLPLSASAADIVDADQIVVSSAIDNSVLTLPEEVAYEIALLFISDAENVGMADWDDSSIVNCVTMYDSSGTDTITAYSFELSRGYVVVSARIDVSNIILEWSSGYDTKYLSMNALANGGYNNHCGPTAITHLAVWYHARYGSDIIAALNNDRTVFQMIADFGINNFYYTQAGGTANALANNYIKRALSQFEISCTVSGRYTTNYTNAYNSLSNNRLLYVMMLNNNNYGDHHVTASAVYKLTNYDMTDTCSFLKVADGHGTSARYLDLDILSNCTYWEVAF